MSDRMRAPDDDDDGTVFDFSLGRAGVLRRSYAVLRTSPAWTIEARGDYQVAQAAGEIVLLRSDTGVGEAVWFGALTGGVRGTIVEFTEQTLRVAPLTSERVRALQPREILAHASDRGGNVVRRRGVAGECRKRNLHVVLGDRFGRIAFDRFLNHIAIQLHMPSNANAARCGSGALKTPDARPSSKSSTSCLSGFAPGTRVRRGQFRRQLVLAHQQEPETARPWVATLSAIAPRDRGELVAQRERSVEPDRREIGGARAAVIPSTSVVSNSSLLSK